MPFIKYEKESLKPYTREQVVKMLPAVGSILMRTPAEMENRRANQRKCVVVQTNAEALWYRVRFVGAGYHQCYKVPEV